VAKDGGTHDAEWSILQQGEIQLVGKRGELWNLKMSPALLGAGYRGGGDGWATGSGKYKQWSTKAVCCGKEKKGGGPGEATTVSSQEKRERNYI